MRLVGAMPRISASALLTTLRAPLLTTLPAALLAALSCGPALGRDYPGWAAPLDSEFRSVPVVTRTGGDLQEPMKMDFDMDAEGNVDVYYVERKGRVRKYDAKKKAIVAGGPNTNDMRG